MDEINADLDELREDFYDFEANLDDPAVDHRMTLDMLRWRLDELTLRTAIKHIKGDK